eukprot:6482458-Amphidinium_carterae.1
MRAARLCPWGTPVCGRQAAACPTSETIQVEEPHTLSKSTTATGTPTCAKIEGCVCRKVASAKADGGS